MRIRPGALLDGAGWSIGLAAAFFAFALIALGLELQSPDLVLWTGHHVVAAEQHGLAYFRWHGHTYATPVPGNGSGPVDVYFDPANPQNSMAEDIPDRVVTALLIAGPAAAGLAVLAIGLTRKRRWAHRRRRAEPAAGGDQDPDVFARLLDERRHGR